MSIAEEPGEVFVCDDCGLTIHRISAPPDYDSKTCFMCMWLRSNEHLTDKERDELRRRLRHQAEAP